jgi:MscS family membrane protein
MRRFTASPFSRVRRLFARLAGAVAVVGLAAVGRAQAHHFPAGFDQISREFGWPDWAQELPDWLRSIHLGLAIWQWIALLLLLLSSLLVGYLVRQLATLSLRARYKIPGLEFSQSSKRGTRRAVAILVAAGIWKLVLPSLALPLETNVLIEGIIQIVAAIVLIWLVVSLWNAFCDVLLHRSESIDKRTERLLVPVTRKFVTAVIILGGTLALLALVGVNVISIIAGLGIGGLAVALAAKDSVENVFGSLTILFDMPFALGDWVKIDKVEGVVEQINLRSTRIRTFEDSLITLPNSNLIKAAVENFGARRFRRQKFPLRFGHESQPDAVEKFCEELRQHIKGLEGVVPEKTIVELNEVTEQWIGVLVICYLDAAAPVDELRLRSKLMAEVLRMARKRNLKFATAAPLPASVDLGTSDPAESALPKVE